MTRPKHGEPDSDLVAMTGAMSPVVRHLVNAFSALRWSRPSAAEPAPELPPAGVSRPGRPG